MRPYIPPALPLFPYTASLYSLALFIPDCSIMNGRVARAISDWLANSVRPVLGRAIQLFRFGFSRPSTRTWPSTLGSDWCIQFSIPQSDWLDFWCFDRGLLLGRLGIGAQLGIRERGYVL